PDQLSSGQLHGWGAVPGTGLVRDDKTTAAVRARALVIVEDDAPIRRALRNALNEVTDRLLEASTGREGLDITATERPDLVILDLGLPDVPGVDVCREIRAWSRVPILVLSARHSDAEKVQLLNAGADDYVTKPFSTPEFVARVRALLRRARLPAADDVTTVVEGYGVTIDLLHRRVRRGGTPIRLTPRERERRATAGSRAHVRRIPVDRLLLPGAVRHALGKQAARLDRVARLPHHRRRHDAAADAGAGASRRGRAASRRSGVARPARCGNPECGSGRGFVGGNRGADPHVPRDHALPDLRSGTRCRAPARGIAARRAGRTAGAGPRRAPPLRGDRRRA